jgi:hypothetical protein
MKLTTLPLLLACSVLLVSAAPFSKGLDTTVLASENLVVTVPEVPSEPLVVEEGSNVVASEPLVVEADTTVVASEVGVFAPVYGVPVRAVPVTVPVAEVPEIQKVHEAHEVQKDVPFYQDKPRVAHTGDGINPGAAPGWGVEWGGEKKIEINR